MSAPAVMVTGVSSGIGLATAEACAAAGFQVYGSVRSRSDGAAFEAALGGAGQALQFDVSDEPAIREAARRVAAETEGGGLFGLVNNAGIAVAGPLEHLPLDRLRWQLEVNLTGVLAVTQAFLPLLKQVGPSGRAGRIVNIGSVAGLVPMPFTGAYAASKAALTALNESLRRELMIVGVGVTLIVPAAIRTPLWDKGNAEDMRPYGQSAYAEVLPNFKREALASGRAGPPAARVGAAVVTALTARRPPVRTVLTASPVTTAMMGWMPRGLLDRIIARRLGFPAPPRPPERG